MSQHCQTENSLGRLPGAAVFGGRIGAMMLKTATENHIFGVIAILVWGLSLGCAQIRYDPIPAQGTFAKLPELIRKTDALRQALMGLSPVVDPAEAEAVSQAAVIYPMTLANRYELIKPPIFHNILINAGAKHRGLCSHWTEDILIRLRGMHLKSFRLFWGVANSDKLFRLQHSCVVIAAIDQGFDEGIVLDGWRKSGLLVWAKVTDDTYEWQNRYLDPDKEWP